MLQVFAADFPALSNKFIKWGEWGTSRQPHTIKLRAELLFSWQATTDLFFKSPWYKNVVQDANRSHINLNLSKDL